MANHRSRVEKPQGGLTSILEFANKNWQGIGIILAVVAIFVWYQALGLGTLFNRQQASIGVADESKEMEKQMASEEPKKESQEDTAVQAPKDSPLKVPVPAETPTQTPSAAGDTFLRKAEPGQGITHLARGALQDYLTSVKPQVNLSREQKIYIEDYLKDNTGAKKITPDQELSFSGDSIARAIELSQKLTPRELSNLTQYANRVPSLQAYQPVQ